MTLVVVMILSFLVATGSMAVLAGVVLSEAGHLRVFEEEIIQRVERELPTFEPLAA